jgi:hypothetical protein
LDGRIKTKDNEIASFIAKYAEEKSIDPYYESPFSKKANLSGWANYRGGKQDDITVIISQIFISDNTQKKSESSAISIPFSNLQNKI